MTDVRSNYNFVPAPNEKKKEVFLPDWGDQVSHDIPFKDGESGSIELTIKAEAPIFIRNGHAGETEEREFSHVEINGEKKYFIPASSTKGMLRNVIEILGKGRIKQISDDKYSFRDLTRNSLYMRSYESNKVECGWLFEDENGNWKIEDCGKPLRISHEDLDPIINTNFRRAFLNRNPTEKTAKYKYANVKGSLTHKFRTEKDEYKTLAVKDDNGVEGTIVLTGQSSKRKEDPNRRPSGKIYEFVFLKSTADQLIDVTEKQQRDFKFIYLDHDKSNISKDWEFWSRKLDNGKRVPVFFNRDGDTRVKHFGLAYMYKLPYETSIHETFPYNTYDFKSKDLAETMFGTTDENTAKLKGRVMVSHAFSDDAEPAAELSKEILAGPKASYFPFYIDQTNSANRYKTYMDNDVKIRGFKRYPIHKNIKKGKYDEKQLRNPKVFSFFRPLQAGATFNCVIHFHNLKKVEIGALLSAITFHQQGNKFFHSIGGAKAFGYGKISLNIKELKYLEHSVEDYLMAFEKKMEDKFPDWLNSETLTELLAMASEPKSDEQNKQLVYPKLALPNAARGEANEFVNYKKEGAALPKYSEINGAPKLSSIAQKKAMEEKVAGGNYIFNGNNLKELKKQIKEELSNNVSSKIHGSLKDAIKEAILNHNPTRGKLITPEFEGYEWTNTLTMWFGDDTKAFHGELQNWHKELTGKEK